MKKNYIFFGFLLILISCEESDVPNQIDERRDRPSYDFTITGSEGGPHRIVGNNLESSEWKKDKGYIFLSTDLVKEPIGTLTFYIGDILELGSARIIDATVSKTDVREGTLEQLNARTFFLESSFVGSMDSITVGNNFISARFEMEMSGKVAFEETEYVTAKGWFVAVSDYDD